MSEESKSMGLKANWHGPKQVWIMFIAALLMLIGAAIVGCSTNTVLPFISQSRHWDYSFLAMMAGVGVFSAVAGGLFWGWLAVKKGAKFIIICSLVFGAIFLTIYGSTNSLGLFVFCIMMLGFASGGYKESAALILTTNWFPRKKGIALGWITMGIPIANILYEPFIPRVFAKFGFFATEIFIALFLLLIALVVALFVKNTPEEMNTYPDGDPTGLEDLKSTIKAMREYRSPFTFKRMLTLKQTWQVGIGWGFIWLVAMAYVSQIVPSLLANGYDFNYAATVLMVSGLCALFGSWLFGFIDQKIGTKKASIAYTIAAIIVLPCVMFNGYSPIIPWITSIFFIGSMAGINNLIPSMIGTLFGRWDFPAANRTIYPICNFMAGVGIFAGGLFSGTLGYNALWITCIVINIIALVIIIFTKTEMIGKKDQYVKVAEVSGEGN
jgi:OFA family oxalate/formate antiporter-like MFS transporter